MRNLIHTVTYSILAFALLFTAGCAKEEWTSPSDGQETVVSFSLNIDNGLETRAISDGQTVNQLIVAVYENGTEIKSLRTTYDWSHEENPTVDLRLIKDRSYQVLFWLQYTDENHQSAYSIDDKGNVSVNYSGYLTGGFAKMEQLDAFCALKTVTPTDETENSVDLIRPVAQLNFADPDNANADKEATVKLKNVVTSYNILTGKTVENPDEMTFIFNSTPKDGESDDRLNSGTGSYNYIASIYLFPTTVQAEYQIEGLTKNVGTVPLKANTRTNIIGTLVPTTSVWDGTETNEPEVDATDEVYKVADASELAWLANSTPENWNGKARKGFRMTNDLDMDGHKLASIELPDGATVNGNGFTISDLHLGGAVFSDAMNLTVTDLTIEKVTIDGTDATHVGVLVNTLKGSSSFTNVAIKDAVVSTSNGAAGGIVGYITKDENSTDPLNVTFDNCHVAAKSIAGSISEGGFVGLFQGYDNSELLTFNDNCSFTASEAAAISGKVSPYTEGNEAEWLSENDYSKFNGWLGNEEYYRGIVNYGSNRFIPKWDGTTKVTPLTETGATVIYSAFDLAYAQGKSLSLVFRESVDMASKTFEPLAYITDLHGNDNTIYNLKVDTKWDGDAWSGGAFARRCKGGTFDNITFKNADVKVTHSTDDGDAYAAIVCATLEGDPVTINNVKVIGGSLYGVNKMGGIAGYIVSDLNCTDCVVDGLSIENYDSGGKDSFGFKANGEVGGMFGFLAANATISGSYVKNTTLNCIGVDNGRVLVLFKYAGRHVNEFIGDIRTTSGQKITITYTDSNFTGNQYKNRKDQYSGCNKIGHCYYTNISAFGIGITDTKGTVNVNGNSITVAKNY